MGYSTDFKGELKFKKELKATELAYLKTLLSKDRREIGFEDDSKVYESDDEYWHHINLELTEDFSGLRWNYSEKTYDLNHIVNFVTKQMKKKFNDFELIGQLNAQGEDIEDRWTLLMENGVAKKIPVEIKGKRIECPLCEQEFILEENDELVKDVNK